MSEYTPGPWDFNPRNDEGFRVHTMFGSMADAVCDVDEWQGESTTFANARLIAAAPELLSALDAVLGMFDTSDVRHLMGQLGETAYAHKIINEGRAAIKKATE